MKPRIKRERCVFSSDYQHTLAINRTAAKACAYENEMEADALTSVVHQGFVVDAEAMTTLLYHFATTPTIAPP